MSNLLTVNPKSWFLFILFALFIGVLIRCATSFWRSIEVKSNSRKKFWKIFKGTGLSDEDGKTIAADHWLGFVIGVLEIISYSVLLASQNAVFIGAWLAFKTAHRYRYASGIKRGHFNRYLLGNALVLIASYLLARNMFCRG